MARVVLGSYMIRYPLGGNLSWALQWLVALRGLGHDVYFVEQAGYPQSCYDPRKRVMTDDCTFGVNVVAQLLARFDLSGRWSYVDAGGVYQGMSRERVEEIFQTCEIFIDLGAHGNWLDRVPEGRLRVFVEGEPGFTQMKMELALAAGEQIPEYDYYCSAGANIGTDRSTAPTAGRAWRHVPNVVVTDLFSPSPPPRDAPFTTVMNWSSHGAIDFEGRRYGQKDMEFAKFAALPRHVDAPMEVAVSGRSIPKTELRHHGWRITDAHDVSLSVDAYWDYIRRSFAEFSVAKNIFVDTNSGWFSDRSAVYLSLARPVVLQDTGFAGHLPSGEGLFAVSTVDEAASAISEIKGNYGRHSRAAREIAVEYLDAPRVLKALVDELDV